MGQDVTISRSGAFNLTLIGTTTINGNANTAILLDDTANNSLTLDTSGGTTNIFNSTSFLVNNTGTLTVAGPIAITAAKFVTLGGTDPAGKIVISGSTTNTTGGFTINTAGTVTLSGTNLHSGTTTLTAGKLNIGNASTLGTGALTLTSGTFDNSTGSALTMATNNSITIGGNVTFGGTNDLTFGTGNLNYSASRTLTLSGTHGELLHTRRQQYERHRAIHGRHYAQPADHAHRGKRRHGGFQYRQLDPHH